MAALHCRDLVPQCLSLLPVWIDAYRLACGEECCNADGCGIYAFGRSSFETNLILHIDCQLQRRSRRIPSRHVQWVVQMKQHCSYVHVGLGTVPHAFAMPYKKYVPYTGWLWQQALHAQTCEKMKV